MSNRRSIFEFAGSPELAAIMAERSHIAELDVVASLICNPVQTVPIAMASGFTVDAIDAPDLRIVAAVVVAAAHHPDEFSDEEFFELLAKSLRERGWWDDLAPVAPPFGCRWNRANLKKLCGLEYPCRATIARNVRRLSRLNDLKQSAARHLFKGSDLMLEAACQK